MLQSKIVDICNNSELVYIIGTDVNNYLSKMLRMITDKYVAKEFSIELPIANINLSKDLFSNSYVSHKPYVYLIPVSIYKDIARDWTAPKNTRIWVYEETTLEPLLNTDYFNDLIYVKDGDLVDIVRNDTSTHLRHAEDRRNLLKNYCMLLWHQLSVNPNTTSAKLFASWLYLTKDFEQAEKTIVETDEVPDIFADKSMVEEFKKDCFELLGEIDNWDAVISKLSQEGESYAGCCSY